MYAPLDQLNFTVSVLYLVKDMDMLPRDGHRFTEHSVDFGDVELLGTYTVCRAEVHQFLVKGGLGLPGSIDASMNGFPLEYIMQLGSGTVSLRPGFSYLGRAMPMGVGTDCSYHSLERALLCACGDHQIPRSDCSRLRLSRGLNRCASSASQFFSFCSAL
jgi:hypothetical protein